MKLERPVNLNKHLSDYVELYALAVREKVVQWYAWHWLTKVLFRTLKKQGLDLESGDSPIWTLFANSPF